MSKWKLVHVDNGTNGTTKVYQDEDGNVRIDSFNGNVRDINEHDRFTLNTRNGGNISGHGYGHKNPFNTEKGSSKTKK